MDFIRRGASALLSLRTLFSAGLAGVFFLGNCVLSHAAEVNLWTERRKHLSTRAAAGPVSQLAALPGSLAAGGLTASRIAGQRFPAPDRRLGPDLLRSRISSRSKTSLSPIHHKAALPLKYGSVTRIHEPNSSSSRNVPVILFHDVHLNIEAQRNIGNALQELIENNQVSLIALEGAFSPIDFTPFRTVPHRDTVQKVADAMLEENKISGPVHACLTSVSSVPAVVGIDDAARYRANVAAYRRAAPLVDKRKAKLGDLRRALEARKANVLNAALAAFDRKVEAYRESRLSLGEYARFLSVEIRVTPRRRRPHLDAFARAVELESTLDFSRVESERSSLLAQLLNNIGKERTAELMGRSADFQSGGMKHADFYLYLKDLCERSGVPLSRFPAMKMYVEYTILADGLDADKLFEEFRDRESEIYETLAKTADERACIAAGRRLFLTGKLVDFALTKEEWEEYRTSYLVRRSSYKEDPHREDFGGPGHLSAFESFYLEAEARDELMAANVQKEITKSILPSTKNEAPGAVVLIAGGFHSAGIARRLAGSGFTVIDFVPKITKVETENGSAYLSAFTQEKTPLEKLFDGEKLFLAKEPWTGPLQLKAGLETVKAEAKTYGVSRPASLLRALVQGSGLKVSAGFSVAGALVFVLAFEGRVLIWASGALGDLSFLLPEALRTLAEAVLYFESVFDALSGMGQAGSTPPAWLALGALVFLFSMVRGPGGSGRIMNIRTWLRRTRDKIRVAMPKALDSGRKVEDWLKERALKELNVTLDETFLRRHPEIDALVKRIVDFVRARLFVYEHKDSLQRWREKRGRRLLDLFYVQGKSPGEISNVFRQRTRNPSNIVSLIHEWFSTFRGTVEPRIKTFRHLQKYWPVLSDQERHILRLYLNLQRAGRFGPGLSVKEIAAELHLSRSEVNRSLQSAEKKLREEAYGRSQTSFVRSHRHYLCYLAEKQRAAIEMTYLGPDGMILSPMEVAEKMGSTRVNAVNLIILGLRNLRTLSQEGSLTHMIETRRQPPGETFLEALENLRRSSDDPSPAIMLALFPEDPEAKPLAGEQLSKSRGLTQSAVGQIVVETKWRLALRWNYPLRVSKGERRILNRLEPAFRSIYKKNKKIPSLSEVRRQTKYWGIANYHSPLLVLFLRRWLQFKAPSEADAGFVTAMRDFLWRLEPHVVGNKPLEMAAPQTLSEALVDLFKKNNGLPSLQQLMRHKRIQIKTHTTIAHSLSQHLREIVEDYEKSGDQERETLAEALRRSKIYSRYLQYGDGILDHEAGKQGIETPSSLPFLKWRMKNPFEKPTWRIILFRGLGGALLERIGIGAVLGLLLLLQAYVDVLLVPIFGVASDWLVGAGYAILAGGLIGYGWEHVRTEKEIALRQGQRAPPSKRQQASHFWIHFAVLSAHPVLHLVFAFVFPEFQLLIFLLSGVAALIFQLLWDAYFLAVDNKQRNAALHQIYLKQLGQMRHEMLAAFSWAETVIRDIVEEQAEKFRSDPQFKPIDHILKAMDFTPVFVWMVKSFTQWEKNERERDPDLPHKNDSESLLQDIQQYVDWIDRLADRLNQLNLIEQAASLRYLVRFGQRCLHSFIKTKGNFDTTGDPVSVDVNRSIDTVLSYIRLSSIGTQRLHITFSPGDNLPPVRMDQDLLSMVWDNLIRNAAEAGTGGKTPLTITTRMEDGRVRIDVADQGSGIAPQNLSRIFEPGFTTKSAGHGVGLPLIKQIIEKAGGRIKAQSEEGKGTTFTIWLPAENEPASISSGGQSLRQAYRRSLAAVSSQQLRRNNRRARKNASDGPSNGLASVTAPGDERLGRWGSQSRRDQAVDPAWRLGEPAYAGGGKGVVPSGEGPEKSAGKNLFRHHPAWREFGIWISKRFESQWNGNRKKDLTRALKHLLQEIRSSQPSQVNPFLERKLKPPAKDLYCVDVASLRLIFAFDAGKKLIKLLAVLGVSDRTWGDYQTLQNEKDNDGIYVSASDVSSDIIEALESALNEAEHGKPAALQVNPDLPLRLFFAGLQSADTLEDAVNVIQRFCDTHLSDAPDPLLSLREEISRAGQTADTGADVVKAWDEAKLTMMLLVDSELGGEHPNFVVLGTAFGQWRTLVPDEADEIAVKFNAWKVGREGWFIEKADDDFSLFASQVTPASSDPPPLPASVIRHVLLIVLVTAVYLISRLQGKTFNREAFGQKLSEETWFKRVSLAGAVAEAATLISLTLLFGLSWDQRLWFALAFLGDYLLGTLANWIRGSPSPIRWPARHAVIALLYVFLPSLWLPLVIVAGLVHVLSDFWVIWRPWKQDDVLDSQGNSFRDVVQRGGGRIYTFPGAQLAAASILAVAALGAALTALGAAAFFYSATGGQISFPSASISLGAFSAQLPLLFLVGIISQGKLREALRSLIERVPEGWRAFQERFPERARLVSSYVSGQTPRDIQAALQEPISGINNFYLKLRSAWLRILKMGSPGFDLRGELGRYSNSDSAVWRTFQRRRPLLAGIVSDYVRGVSGSRIAEERRLSPNYIYSSLGASLFMLKQLEEGRDIRRGVNESVRSEIAGYIQNHLEEWARFRQAKPRLARLAEKFASRKRRRHISPSAKTAFYKKMKEVRVLFQRLLSGEDISRRHMPGREFGPQWEENRKLVQEAFAQGVEKILHPHHQRALQLRYAPKSEKEEASTIRRVAKMIGLTVSGTKAVIHKGLKSLRRALGEKRLDSKWTRTERFAKLARTARRAGHLEQLPEEFRTVIELRLLRKPPMDLPTIGRTLGVTGELIRVRFESGLAHLLLLAHPVDPSQAQRWQSELRPHEPGERLATRDPERSFPNFPDVLLRVLEASRWDFVNAWGLLGRPFANWFGFTSYIRRKAGGDDRFKEALAKLKKYRQDNLNIVVMKESGTGSEVDTSQIDPRPTGAAELSRRLFGNDLFRIGIKETEWGVRISLFLLIIGIAFGLIHAPPHFESLAHLVSTLHSHLAVFLSYLVLLFGTALFIHRWTGVVVRDQDGNPTPEPVFELKRSIVASVIVCASVVGPFALALPGLFIEPLVLRILISAAGFVIGVAFFAFTHGAINDPRRAGQILREMGGWVKGVHFRTGTISISFGFVLSSVLAILLGAGDFQFFLPAMANMTDIVFWLFYKTQGFFSSLTSGGMLLPVVFLPLFLVQMTQAAPEPENKEEKTIAIELDEAWKIINHDSLGPLSKDQIESLQRCLDELASPPEWSYARVTKILIEPGSYDLPPFDLASLEQDASLNLIRLGKAAFSSPLMLQFSLLRSLDQLHVMQSRLRFKASPTYKDALEKNKAELEKHTRDASSSEIWKVIEKVAKSDADQPGPLIQAVLMSRSVSIFHDLAKTETEKEQLTKELPDPGLAAFLRRTNALKPVEIHLLAYQATFRDQPPLRLIPSEMLDPHYESIEPLTYQELSKLAKDSTWLKGGLTISEFHIRLLWVGLHGRMLSLLAYWSLFKDLDRTSDLRKLFARIVRTWEIYYLLRYESEKYPLGDIKTMKQAYGLIGAETMSTLRRWYGQTFLEFCRRLALDPEMMLRILERLGSSLSAQLLLRQLPFLLSYFDEKRAYVPAAAVCRALAGLEPLKKEPALTQEMRENGMAPAIQILIRNEGFQTMDRLAVLIGAAAKRRRIHLHKDLTLHWLCGFDEMKAELGARFGDGFVTEAMIRHPLELLELMALLQSHNFSLEKLDALIKIYGREPLCNLFNASPRLFPGLLFTLHQMDPRFQDLVEPSKLIKSMVKDPDEFMQRWESYLPAAVLLFFRRKKITPLLDFKLDDKAFKLLIDSLNKVPWIPPRDISQHFLNDPDFLIRFADILKSVYLDEEDISWTKWDGLLAMVDLQEWAALWKEDKEALLEFFEAAYQRRQGSLIVLKGFRKMTGPHFMTYIRETPRFVAGLIEEPQGRAQTLRKAMKHGKKVWGTEEAVHQHPSWFQAAYDALVGTPEERMIQIIFGAGVTEGHLTKAIRLLLLSKHPPLKNIPIELSKEGFRLGLQKDLQPVLRILKNKLLPLIEKLVEFASPVAVMSALAEKPKQVVDALDYFIDPGKFKLWKSPSPFPFPITFEQLSSLKALMRWDGQDWARVFSENPVGVVHMAGRLAQAMETGWKPEAVLGPWGEGAGVILDAVKSHAATAFLFLDCAILASPGVAVQTFVQEILIPMAGRRASYATREGWDAQARLHEAEMAFKLSQKNGGNGEDQALRLWVWLLDRVHLPVDKLNRPNIEETIQRRPELCARIHDILLTESPDGELFKAAMGIAVRVPPLFKKAVQEAAPEQKRRLQEKAVNGLIQRTFEAIRSSTINKFHLNHMAGILCSDLIQARTGSVDPHNPMDLANEWRMREKQAHRALVDSYNEVTVPALLADLQQLEVPIQNPKELYERMEPATLARLMVYVGDNMNTKPYVMRRISNFLEEDAPFQRCLIEALQAGLAQEYRHMVFYQDAARLAMLNPQSARRILPAAQSGLSPKKADLFTSDLINALLENHLNRLISAPADILLSHPEGQGLVPLRNKLSLENLSHWQPMSLIELHELLEERGLRMEPEIIKGRLNPFRFRLWEGMLACPVSVIGRRYRGTRDEDLDPRYQTGALGVSIRYGWIGGEAAKSAGDRQIQEVNMTFLREETADLEMTAGAKITVSVKGRSYVFTTLNPDEVELKLLTDPLDTSVIGREKPASEAITLSVPRGDEITVFTWSEDEPGVPFQMSRAGNKLSIVWIDEAVALATFTSSPVPPRLIVRKVTLEGQSDWDVARTHMRQQTIERMLEEEILDALQQLEESRSPETISWAAATLQAALHDLDPGALHPDPAMDARLEKPYFDFMYGSLRDALSRVHFANGLLPAEQAEALKQRILSTETADRLRSAEKRLTGTIDAYRRVLYIDPYHGSARNRRTLANRLLYILKHNPETARTLRRLDELGHFDYFLEELAALRGVAQGRFHQGVDALEHTLKAMEAMDGLINSRQDGYGSLSDQDWNNTSPPKELRLAALFHDIGKSGGHMGHAGRGEDALRHFLATVNAPASVVERLSQRVRLHQVLGDMITSRKVRRDAKASKGYAPKPGDPGYLSEGEFEDQQRLRIERFAQTLLEGNTRKDALRLLNDLYLLTIADASGASFQEHPAGHRYTPEFAQALRMYKEMVAERLGAGAQTDASPQVDTPPSAGSAPTGASGLFQRFYGNDLFKIGVKETDWGIFVSVILLLTGVAFGIVHAPPAFASLSDLFSYLDAHRLFFLPFAAALFFAALFIHLWTGVVVRGRDGAPLKNPVYGWGRSIIASLIVWVSVVGPFAMMLPGLFVDAPMGRILFSSLGFAIGWVIFRFAHGAINDPQRARQVLEGIWAEGKGVHLRTVTNEKLRLARGGWISRVAKPMEGPPFPSDASSSPTPVRIISPFLTLILIAGAGLLYLAGAQICALGLDPLGIALPSRVSFPLFIFTSLVFLGAVTSGGWPFPGPEDELKYPDVRVVTTYKGLEGIEHIEDGNAEFRRPAYLKEFLEERGTMALLATSEDRSVGYALVRWEPTVKRLVNLAIGVGMPRWRALVNRLMVKVGRPLPVVATVRYPQDVHRYSRLGFTLVSFDPKKIEFELMLNGESFKAKFADSPIDAYILSSLLLEVFNNGENPLLISSSFESTRLGLFTLLLKLIRMGYMGRISPENQEKILSSSDAVGFGEEVRAAFQEWQEHQEHRSKTPSEDGPTPGGGPLLGFALLVIGASVFSALLGGAALYFSGSIAFPLPIASISLNGFWPQLLGPVGQFSMALESTLADFSYVLYAVAATFMGPFSGAIVVAILMLALSGFAMHFTDSRSRAATTERRSESGNRSRKSFEFDPGLQQADVHPDLATLLHRINGRPLDRGLSTFPSGTIVLVQIDQASNVTTIMREAMAVLLAPVLEKRAVIAHVSATGGEEARILTSLNNFVRHWSAQHGVSTRDLEGRLTVVVGERGLQNVVDAAYSNGAHRADALRDFPRGPLEAFKARLIWLHREDAQIIKPKTNIRLPGFELSVNEIVPVVINALTGKVRVSGWTEKRRAVHSIERAA